MTRADAHEQQLERAVQEVNEAIRELNDAHTAAAKAQTTANPVDRHIAWQKLEDAERRAEHAREQLLSEANESQEQQTVQSLQELQDAMDGARQF